MKLLKDILSKPIASFIWLIYALVVFYMDDGKSFVDHNRYLLCVSISYFLCLFAWLSKGNRVFSLFTFFIVFSFLYNTSQSLIYAFTEDTILLYVYRNYALEDVCYMLKYQFLCTSGLYAGVSIFLNKPSHNLSQNELVTFYKEKKSVHLKNDKMLFALFAFSTFVVFAFTIYQLLLRQTMSYSELYENRESISPYFSFCAILLGLYFVYQKRHVKIVFTFYVWCIVAYTLAGTRSMAIVYVGALWLLSPMVFPKYFQRKYYPVMGLIAILAVISINIVSQMRTSGFGAGGDVDTGEMGALVASLNEMGISQVPTMITIEHFSEQGYSQTILYFLLLSIFPSFILTEVTPEAWQLRIGAWATDISNTIYTQWGSSWIAESYFNYGEFGWLFILLYGYLIAYAENMSLRKIMNGKYLFALCVLACLCKQLFYVRAEIYLLIDYFKPCVYIGLIWLIFHKKKQYENSNISRRVRHSHQ